MATQDMTLNRLSRVALATLLLVASTSATAAAQGLSDLMGQKTNRVEQSPAGDLDVRLGRDRVDLGLSPNLRSILAPEKKSVGVSAQADLRMICGQYDLKASLQHLLGREAR